MTPDLRRTVAPILPGFHPDPSICRVGDTSWMVGSNKYAPGVPLFRSTDLVSWDQMGHVRYVSTEVAGGMTGRMLGVWCSRGRLVVRSFTYAGADRPDQVPDLPGVREAAA